MKKLLSILAAVGLTATAASSVVSCTPINKTTKNDLDSNGNVAYTTRNKLRIQKGAVLTKDGNYYDVKSTDLGDPATKDGVFGVTYYYGKDGVNLQSGSSLIPNSSFTPSDAPTTAKDSVYYRVAASDIPSKDIDSTTNTLTKEVKAKISVTVTAGSTDDEGNKAGYKFDDQHYSWMLLVLKQETKTITNSDGTTTQVTGFYVDSLIERAKINIERNPKADITGVASVNDAKNEVTVSSENMFTLTDEQKTGLKAALSVDGDTVTDAKVVNSQLVITLQDPLKAGSHVISAPTIFEGTAVVNI